MSNIVLQPNASGTGSITITTPNTNTDRTLNIPDVAGNIVTTGDSGTVTGTMIGSLPTGSIVQVVQGVLRPSDNGGFFLTTTSTSFQSALLNASITPTSSSNKILIMVAFQVYGGGRASIYQDGTTNLGDSNYGFARIQKGNGWHEQTLVYLHSPNTTSSVNYKLYGSSDGATVYFGGDGDIPNTITLMEIVG